MKLRVRSTTDFIRQLRTTSTFPFSSPFSVHFCNCNRRTRRANPNQPANLFTLSFFHDFCSYSLTNVLNLPTLLLILSSKKSNTKVTWKKFSVSGSVFDVFSVCRPSFRQNFMFPCTFGGNKRANYSVLKSSSSTSLSNQLFSFELFLMAYEVCR